MTLQDLEKIVVKAFCELDSSILDQLEEWAFYSYDYKEELIEKLDKLFKKYQSAGLTNLEVRDSECKYCNPKANAYSFHNPETGEFLIRYVFTYEGETDEGESIFGVDQCDNSTRGILFKEYLDSISKYIDDADKD